AGGDERRRRHHGPEAAGIADQRAVGAAVVDENLLGHRILQNAHARHRRLQAPLDLGARGVAAGVDDAAVAVPALAGARVPTGVARVGLRIEPRAQRYEPFDGVGARTD